MPEEKNYLAHIYSDDPRVVTNTKVKVATTTVDAGSILTVNLLPSGGQAIWLKTVD